MSKKTFTSTAQMRKEAFERANQLLDIDDFEELTDEERADLHVEEGCSQLLYSTTFEDGTAMDVYLYSGQSNYYTGPTLRRTDGRIYVPADAIGESLSETDEFLIDGDTYVTRITLV